MKTGKKKTQEEKLFCSVVKKKYFISLSNCVLMCTPLYPGQEPSPEAERFMKNCTTRCFLSKNNKVHTTRILDTLIPSELIPEGVWQLYEAHKNGELTKEKFKSIASFYGARNKLRRYGLLEASQYGKSSQLPEAEKKQKRKDYYRKWEARRKKISSSTA